MINLKKFIHCCLVNAFTGKLIRLIFGNSIPFHGIRLCTDQKEVNDITIGDIFWGFYESAEIRFAKKYLRAENDIIELGASIGGVSSILSSLLKLDNKLILVEAFPPLIPLLQTNLHLNSHGKRYFVLQTAVGKDGEYMEFEIGKLNTGGRLLTDNSGTALKIKAQSLSSIKNEMGIKDFSLICDIEGAEFFLVKYDRAGFDGCKEILIELHDYEIKDKKYSVDVIASEFETLGFRCMYRYGNVFYFDRKDIN